MSFPDFGFFQPQTVVSAKTATAYTLDRITVLPSSDETFVNLVTLCNQPAIYETLFKKICGGVPYTAESARSFLQRGRKGWDENTHFVFILQDEGKNQVAAIDIKSNNRDTAEIGYWASDQHPGIMTPAVRALCEIAEQAGYKSLFACALTSNLRSQKVLLNNAFIQDPGILTTDDKQRYVFKKALA